jgi:hypothetical protein
MVSDKIRQYSPGEVTEWFKVLVLKTSVGQLTASSNLALSAKKKHPKQGVFSWFR